MNKLSILAELWGFLKERKKWWLTPIILFLLLLAAMIVYSMTPGGLAVAPFIYTLF